MALGEGTELLLALRSACEMLSFTVTKLPKSGVLPQNPWVYLTVNGILHR